LENTSQADEKKQKRNIKHDRLKLDEHWNNPRERHKWMATACSGPWVSVLAKVYKQPLHNEKVDDCDRKGQG
jgi:hypothetical protein